ncbi:hypothetical protein R1sor_003727 [Riccia sorocarpa]|uniref:Uncharacterized protein n=1 Tax=Riccia sorocarpa TaxID=122646 RepID=A0ABD3H5T0_9MARC
MFTLDAEAVDIKLQLDSENVTTESLPVLLVEASRLFTVNSSFKRFDVKWASRQSHLTQATRSKKFFRRSTRDRRLADSAFTVATSQRNPSDNSPIVEKPSTKKKLPRTGRKNTGKKSSQRSSPIGTRSVARTRNPEPLSKLPSVSESESPNKNTSGGADEKTDTTARRALWVGEMASSSASGGAFVIIIAKYTMDFGGNPTPKIPLCRLVPFCRMRNYQTTSHMTEALKRSFETHCYMEHGTGFHVCPFNGSGKELFVTDADRQEWDMLWKMESDAFDEECRKNPAYSNLIGRKFATWDGNHRVITWMKVSLSPERTMRKAWHPRVRCVIICPPVQAYKQIEVAMHNLNASSHATVQYDWIHDAERCYQVLSTPLSEYKEMIGDDVYEEFEKSRLKTHANHRPWYSENMTAAAAAYILSYAEITVAKEAHRAAEEEEEKKKGEALSAVEKKEMWDDKVKEVCGPWQAMVFKYATITNPQLGPDFMLTVRELHNTIAKQEKKEWEVTYSVGVDRVKAFASADIHNSLKLELLRAHYSPLDVRTKYHHPPKHDVDIDIRPWLAQWSLWSTLELITIDILKKILNKEDQGDLSSEEFATRKDDELDRFHNYFSETKDSFWSSLWYPTDVDNEFCMYSEKDNLCRPISELSEWELENAPWWLEQRCDDSNIKFVSDAEEVCWKKLQAKEEPFKVTDGKFEEADDDIKVLEAALLEPSTDLTGLVVNTSRTKKQKEARQIPAQSKVDNDDGDGQTPSKKSKDKQKNPGSGRSSKSRHKKAEVEAPARKGRKKKAESEPESAADPAKIEATDPNATSPVQIPEPLKEKELDDQERQPKRLKKQKWHDGLERNLIISIERQLVVVKSSLQETYERIQANKRTIPMLPLPILDELKALCARVKGARVSGHCINNTRVQSAADCLYLDMPTGYKLIDDGEVPNWNLYPEVDLPRHLLNLGRSILDDRGSIIIIHPGTL